MNNVFFQMKAIGLTPDRLSMNLILQAYAKSNDVETVLRIFKSMEVCFFRFEFKILFPKIEIFYFFFLLEFC